jgi:hypothetical protein
LIAQTRSALRPDAGFPLRIAASDNISYRRRAARKSIQRRSARNRVIVDAETEMRAADRLNTWSMNGTCLDPQGNFVTRYETPKSRRRGKTA